MNPFPIIILLAFAGYTFISWQNLGPLESLSSTFYKWKEKNYSAAWSIFSAVIFILCCLMTGVKDVTKLILVGAGFCMWALTVAANYQQYKRLHYGFTIACIALGFAAVASEFGFGYKFWTSLVAFGVGSVLIMLLPVKYKLTWVELLATIAIFYWFI